MNLYEAFVTLARPLGLDPKDLLRYAGEDVIGGYHADPHQQRWYCGSMWEVEGQILYALVRALQPDSVLEVGSFLGCSATHMLEAMAVNEKGHLTSVDIDGSAGRLIPLSLRSRWTLVVARAQDYIGQDSVQAQIVLEDGPHDVEQTSEILRAVKDHIDYRICLSHDGAHFLVGKNIQEAHQQVFGSVGTLLVEPSDCGFAYQIGRNGRKK